MHLQHNNAYYASHVRRVSVHLLVIVMPNVRLSLRLLPDNTVAIQRTETAARRMPDLPSSSLAGFAATPATLCLVSSERLLSRLKL